MDLHFRWQYWLSMIAIVISGVLFQGFTIARRLFLKKCGERIVVYSSVETVLFMIQQGWSYGLMFLVCEIGYYIHFALWSTCCLSPA